MKFGFRNFVLYQRKGPDGNVKSLMIGESSRVQKNKLSVNSISSFGVKDLRVRKIEDGCNFRFGY